MHRVKTSLFLTLILLLLCGTCFSADLQSKPETTGHQIELYVTSWCPYCKKAEAYLDQQGIAYRLYDIEKDAEAARRMAGLTGQNGIPFAIVNGAAIQGWSEKAYAAALRKNGE